MEKRWFERVKVVETVVPFLNILNEKGVAPEEIKVIPGFSGCVCCRIFYYFYEEVKD